MEGLLEGNVIEDLCMYCETTIAKFQTQEVGAACTLLSTLILIPFVTYINVVPQPHTQVVAHNVPCY